MKRLGPIASILVLAMIGCAHAQEGAPAQPPQSQQHCQTPAHRAFDFWVGEWRLYVTGTDTLAGQSTIRLEDGGCVITEHYQSRRGPFGGQSLNIYSAEKGRWEQFWVDNTGDIIHFTGNLLPTGEMQLTDEDDIEPGSPQHVFNRMTFTVNADGTLRQHGEASTDRGATWAERYDFTYRRAQ